MSVKSSAAGTASHRPVTPPAAAPSSAQGTTSTTPRSSESSAAGFARSVAASRAVKSRLTPENR